MKHVPAEVTRYPCYSLFEDQGARAITMVSQHGKAWQPDRREHQTIPVRIRGGHGHRHYGAFSDRRVPKDRQYWLVVRL
jgi:hypothetical protein